MAKINFPSGEAHKDWLDAALKQHPTVKLADLGKYLETQFSWSFNTGPTLLSRVVKGTRKLKAEEIPVIIDFFNNLEAPTSKKTPQKTPGTHHRIPVYDLNASAGDGSVMPLEQTPAMHWDLPQELLPFPTAGKNLAILNVRGDSMSPELNDGDRVIIDLNDKHPSPAGIFVLDDGMGGVVVKRLELLFHQSPPMIKMISTNTLFTPYEVRLDQINISGRVILKIGKV